MSAKPDANKKWDRKTARGQDPASGLEDFSQPSGVAVADAAATPPPPTAPPATEEWTWKPVKAGTHRQHRFGPEEADDYPWRPMRTNGDRKSAGGFSRPLPEVFRRELYECAFCGGTGEKSEGSRCPVCHSKGLVKVKPPVVKCPFCHRRGEVPRNSGVTCPVCKGKGWVSIKEPIEVCRSCHGRGRKTGEGLYCGACKGTGVVQVKGARASTPQASRARAVPLEAASRPRRVSGQPSEGRKNSSEDGEENTCFL